jgi:UDPglucose 6-dehydrogenase
MSPPSSTQAAVEVNQRQKLIVLEKLQQELKILKGKTIGLLGLTFKPDTDDMRDAPSLKLISELNRLGARVKAYDPIVSQTGISHGLTGVMIESNPEMLADDCDALVLVTDWAEFLDLDYGKLGNRLHNRLIIDGRNFLNKTALIELGFRYVGVGH